jgi:hypothetical protein
MEFIVPECAETAPSMEYETKRVKEVKMSEELIIKNDI